MQNCPLYKRCPWFYYYNLNNRMRRINSKEFTIEELAYYDGSSGKPAYVAINGVIYDVSVEAVWGGGTHFGLYAGKDLTSEFQSCHGQNGILDNLTKVGVLI